MHLLCSNAAELGDFWCLIFALQTPLALQRKKHAKKKLSIGSRTLLNLFDYAEHKLGGDIDIA